MQILFQVTVAIIIALGTVVQTNAQSTTARSLKVAALLGLTGDASVHAANIRKGVELAADELRERGWTIDIRFEDDQTNAVKTVSAIRMLMTQEYKLFIGPTWDFQANSLRGSLINRDVVALAPALTSAVVGGPVEGIFNLSPQREKGLTTRIASLLERNPSPKAFILTSRGPWGEHHRLIFRKAVEEAGGMVVGDEQFDYGIDAATSRILLMKAKQVDADVLLTTGASGDSANIVRARNAIGLTCKVIGTEDMDDALGLHLLAKDDLKGNVFSIKVQTNANFVGKYRAKYGDAPGVYADGGYDALMILAEATQKTDGSPKAIRNLLLSGAELTSTIQPVRFNQNGDVEGGEFEIQDLSR